MNYVSSLLGKHFTAKSGGWQVKDEFRAMVSFQRRNLLQPFSDLGPFDVIFCRNVAIYFDAPRRLDLFRRLADRLVPAGGLFAGSSESLMDCPWLVPKHHCRTTYYQTAPAAQPSSGGQHLPPPDGSRAISRLEYRL